MSRLQFSVVVVTNLCSHKRTQTFIFLLGSFRMVFSESSWSWTRASDPSMDWIALDWVGSLIENNGVAVIPPDPIKSNPCPWMDPIHVQLRGYPHHLMPRGLSPAHFSVSQEPSGSVRFSLDHAVVSGCQSSYVTSHD